MNKPVVFIHTNEQQLLGAIASAHSFRRQSRHPERFDVRILRLEETPHLYRREGQRYLRMGKMATWHNDDLQSFSPLRRMVPQLMGFQGRALVTDPDVFSVGGDVLELLDSDMAGKAVVCRNLPPEKGGGEGQWASSVLLLDCARLQSWRWDEQIDAMFAGQLDYKRWIQLADEPQGTIGELPEVWNSFDKLEADTRLLHMTERLTQPWKTGLPIDFNMNFQGPSRPPAPLAARPRPAARQALPAAPGPAAGGLLLLAGEGMPGQRRTQRGFRAPRRRGRRRATRRVRPHRGLRRLETGCLMGGEDASGRHVFLVRSSLQYLMATALAADLRERGPQACRMLFMPDMLEPELFLRAAQGWAESPFDRVVFIEPRKRPGSDAPRRESGAIRRRTARSDPGSTARVDDRLQRLRGTWPGGADRHRAAISRRPCGVAPRTARWPTRTSSIARTAWPRSCGRSCAWAASGTTCACWARTRWCRNSSPFIRRCCGRSCATARCSPFPAGALESAALRSLAARLCEATGFMPQAVPAGATVLTVSHSSYATRNPEYPDLMRACAKKLVERRGQFFVKYHPRESQAGLPGLVRAGHGAGDCAHTADRVPVPDAARPAAPRGGRHEHDLADRRIADAAGALRGAGARHARPATPGTGGCWSNCASRRWPTRPASTTTSTPSKIRAPTQACRTRCPSIARSD